MVNASVIRKLVLAALTGSVVAGCGGSATGSSSSTTAAPAGSVSTPSATSAAATSAPATSSAAASAPAAGGVTAPGTKLAVGKTAVVAYDPDYSSNSTKQKLQVTVDSIVKGSLADFHGISLDAAEKAGTPYYVKVRITNVGAGDVSANNNDPGNQIQGIDSTGHPQDSVSFIGDFPRCNDVSAPTPMGPGKSFSSCLTFLVPGGITAAAYIGDSGYFSSPVTWR
jgi:hypothetical protein